MEGIDDYLNKKKWQPESRYAPRGVPIRPRVKETRFYLDNEYFGKGYGAVFPHSVTTVYCILAKYAHSKSQTCFPSAETIMGEGGIKNRTTAFQALKILKIYGIIVVLSKGSKGRVPNFYALLDCSSWKSLENLPFDTVKEQMKKRRTVSKNTGQQSQNKPPNSITGDTQSHLMNSDKEISKKSKKKTEPIKGEMHQSVLPMLREYFEESDIHSAHRELQGDSDVSPSVITLKGLLEQRARDGKIKQIKPIKW